MYNINLPGDSQVSKGSMKHLECQFYTTMSKIKVNISILIFSLLCLFLSYRCRYDRPATDKRINKDCANDGEGLQE